MMKHLSQLTLGVHLHDEATFRNFYPGKNERIVEALKLASEGHGERMLYLSGRVGQGCSHLLQACCHHAHQRGHSSVYLPLRNIKHLSPDILNGIETLDLICLDDLDAIASDLKWEEAIFHLYNRIQEMGSTLIIAAHHDPKALNMSLPDLLSRLIWIVMYSLKPLSDGEKLMVLKKRAENRGINMTDEVGKFILNHCPRHMSILIAALKQLDEASLAAHRRLTIPFVKEVLQL